MRLLQTLEHPNIIRYLDSFLLSPPSDDDDDDDGGGKAGGAGQGRGAQQQHHGNELVIVVEWAAAGDLRRQLRKAAEVGEPAKDQVHLCQAGRPPVRPRALSMVLTYHRRRLYTTTITTRQRGQRLPERTVWRYFHQVCEALRHMHAHRVLHRDLKVGGYVASCLCDDNTFC